MKAPYKVMCRNLIRVLFILTLVSSVVGCGSINSGASNSNAQNDNASVKGRTDNNKKEIVTLWGWNDIREQVRNSFNEKYPNIEIKFVNVPAADITKKLQISLAAGNDLPDIVMVERGARGKVFSMGILDNLEAPPYKADRNNLFEFDIPQNTNADGQIVAIPIDMSIAGLMYKRDLTKQYFGSDDPKQLESIFTNWDTFIKKGIDVKNQSSSKVFMFASLSDAWRILSGQGKQPFIEGKKLNSTLISATLEQLIKFRDAGVVDKLDAWSPAWNASFAEKNHIFYFAPVWSPQYLLENNDKNGKDRWGLMVPPEGGFITGGTSYGILKKAKNKDAAWKFMQYAFLTKEGALVNKQTGVFTHFKSAYDDKDFSKWQHPWFGGQDIGEKFFNDINKTTNDKPQSEYDIVITQSIDLGLKALTADPALTVKAVMEKIIDNIKQTDPSIQF